MSSRHYWPEPKEGMVCQHLVEHKSGDVRWGSLDSNGTWNIGPFHEYLVEQLERFGYLGVRAQFDVEAERVAFEADWQAQFNFEDKSVFRRDNDGFYFDAATEHAWMGWLAAKRHERGL